MRALNMEVVDAVWEALRHRIPESINAYLRGGRRKRVDDRLCFQGILIRLVTGCSWVDVESILDGAVSDTTLRERRDAWIEAGVFDDLAEALAAYDRIIELDFSETCIDGSPHKTPCGGEGTGKNPTNRAKLGHKWSIGTGSFGIPFAWSLSGANCHDSKMLVPTLADARKRGLLDEIETLHLDRGYDSQVVREICSDRASITLSSRNDADAATNGPSSRFISGSAGVSNAPTHGCRTLASFAVIPTERVTIAEPSLPSRWSC